jgi:hypothetical protein
LAAAEVRNSQCPGSITWGSDHDLQYARRKDKGIPTTLLLFRKVLFPFRNNAACTPLPSRTMKAKACVRCRQWKIGCDADVAGPQGCTRCRSVNAQCTNGASYRRLPKRQRLAELQDEVVRLRALTTELTAANSVATASSNQLPSPTSIAWTEPNATVRLVPVQASVGEHSSVHQNVPNGYQAGANLRLTTSQVNELFRIFFARCHAYLPFHMLRSPEIIYEKCPLLLWAICAAASSDASQPLYGEIIRENIANTVLDPLKGSIEVVQALLILCMWPGPFRSQKFDPSFIYLGLATQIALQIGLKRPAIDFPGPGPQTANEDEGIKLTTWIGCFIVNQIMASRLGVPSAIQADYALLASLESPLVPPQLARLCAISHFTVESAQAIGARANNVTGLADPVPRVSLINIYARQFDELRKTRLDHANDIEEIFYLSSMLQLWSFALHNDVPISPETFHIVQRARHDAIALIQIACEKNLALVPFYTRRSVCYAALLLYHIKIGSPYGVEQDALIYDHINRAQYALKERGNGTDLATFLSIVTSPENREEFMATRDKTSHYWKMSAALNYDSARAYNNMLRKNAANIELIPDFLDLDGLLFDVPNTLT